MSVTTLPDHSAGSPAVLSSRSLGSKADGAGRVADRVGAGGGRVLAFQIVLPKQI